MYLSKYRLKLSWDNRIMLNDVLNAHELHRSIQSLFGNTRKDSNVLYVRNFVGVDNAYVYMYSVDKPPMESDHFERVFCRDQNVDFPVGSIIRFRIVCNPTKQVSGKRYFLRTAEERKAWFFRQAQKSGFECLGLSETGVEDITVQKNRTLSFTFESVVFTGLLKVTDSVMFANVLKNGIGAEKAYGMGMLMVV